MAWRQHLLTFSAITLMSVAAQAKTVNFRVNPLALMVSTLSLDVDIKVSSAFTLGPTISSTNFNLLDVALTGTAFGVRGNYFFNGQVFSDSWYLGPFAQSFKYTVKEKVSGTDFEGSITGTIIGMLVGYHWIWDSFNIQLGFGLAAYSTPEKIETKSDAGGTRETKVERFSGTTTTGEFTLGWAF